MRPQARAARAHARTVSAQATKIFQATTGGPAPEGGPRPIYINRHPQPPAKFNRFYGISQSLYTRRVKINMLTDPGPWDIVGECLIKG